LPRALARIHPRFRTPYNGTLLVAVVSFAVSWLFAAHLDDLTRIVNFGALSGFLLLHVSVVNHYFRRQHSRDWLRHLICPIAGIVVIGYVLYEMDAKAKLLGACWLGIGVLYYVTLSRVTRKRPSALQADASS